MTTNVTGVDWSLVGDGGISAGYEKLRKLITTKQTRGSDLFLLLGYEEDDNSFHRLSDYGIGNFEEFIRNVSPVNGKLSTVMWFRCDSAVAYATNENDEFFGTADNPRRWRGGVYIPVIHTRPDGTQVRIAFVAAASGDYGIVDEVVARAAANEAAFQWLRQQKAFDEVAES